MQSDRLLCGEVLHAQGEADDLFVADTDGSAKVRGMGARGFIEVGGGDFRLGDEGRLAADFQSRELATGRFQERLRVQEALDDDQSTV